MRALIVAAAAVALLVNHYYKGMGDPLVVTLAVFICAVAFARESWGKWQYWAVLLVLLAATLPLNLYLRPWMAGFLGKSLVAVIEIVVVGFALSLVAPDRGANLGRDKASK